ncbi:hypothetical protein [Patulibacter sp. SYSU D01012]|uniref:hypothetical protein n=1 Tax=Patulibacter sp. SYSU D01012 TaxID=2817381 RepID=UPI001B3178FF|nr:hypothetical protein [Patulibacter sp. SYSU D01012]
MPPLRLPLALGIAAALLGPTAAHAAVTTSAVTSVSGAQQPHMSDDRDQAATASANQITVAGTTDGTTGDNVKIVCSSRNNTVNQTFSASTPVNADGSFSATGSMRNIYTYLNLCDLRAVPTGGGMPSVLAPFAAKRVQVGEHYSYKHGSGPNAGVVTDFWIEGAGDKAGAGYNSIGGCGLCDMSLHNPTTLEMSPELYGSNAALFSGTVTAGGVSRPSAKIDGAPAYTSESAVQTNQSASGVPPLQWTQHVDPDTGDLTITETDALVTCATFPVTNGSADCPAFTPTGVTIKRTIKQNHDGQLVAITDRITSTDGNAHTYDFAYFQWIGSQGGYRFPGESGFSPHTTNDVVAGEPGPAAVSQFILNNSSAPSFNNPLGAMVTTPAADRYAFGSPGYFYDVQTGAVPADGAATVRHIYALAADTTTLDRLKSDAVDVYVAPSVTLDAPADVSTNQATLTGTASAMGTLTSVTVNGVAATIDGQGHWAATIPVTEGANAVTVVATNSAGLTKTETGSVTYAVPTPPSTPSTPDTPTPPTTEPSKPAAPTPAAQPLPVATIPVTTAPTATKTLDVALTTKNTKVAQTPQKTTRIALACTGNGTCAGVVRMTKVLRVRGVRTRVLLGTATYEVQAGKTVLVPLKLTGFGKKMLGRQWKRILHAQVRVTQSGVTSGGTVAIKRTK